MKINRFVALAAVAVLVVGAMSAFALRTFAQTAPAAPAQDCAADQADDAAEAESQAEAETDAESGAAECDEGQADANDAATEAEAEGDEDNGAADEQDPAPAGTPAITAEAAQQIAEANQNGATAARVELEDEDGRLSYSVEFDTAAGVTEVQVDAMTGEVVATETGDD